MKGALACLFVMGLAARVSSSNSDPSEAPAICAAEGSDGTLVTHEECSKFYKCSEGVPVALNCPAGLQWNSNQEICDWPENVNCVSKSFNKDSEVKITESFNPKGNADPSQAPEICAAEGSDGVLVAHIQCDKFYKCSEGVPVALNCPPGLQWNSNQDICDWPENVNCVSNFFNKDNDEVKNAKSFNPKGNADPSQAPEICAAEGSDGVLVAHIECDKFYKCSEGVPVALNCPPGLQWNSNQDICDWPENVNCVSKIFNKDNDEVKNAKSFNPKGNADPSQAPEICAAEGSDGVLVAHIECDKFYKCSEGVPVALNCPPGLQWNSNQDICDWPENVNCVSKNFNKDIEVKITESLNPKGNADPSQAPEICAAEGSDGVLVVHIECDKFYKCSEGLPVALNCPPGLQWNSNQDICDWPENVKCNSNIRSRSSTNSCVSQPSGALVPHEQCNKFYLCNQGIPFVLICPENLHYNPENKICDWPELVDCGDRT